VTGKISYRGGNTLQREPIQAVFRDGVGCPLKREMKAGDRAEKIAAGYLQRKGLALIETHYRCRWGEIDLILRDRDTVVSPRSGCGAPRISAAPLTAWMRANRRGSSPRRATTLQQEGRGLPVRRCAPRFARAPAGRMDTRCIRGLSCAGVRSGSFTRATGRSGAFVKKVTVE